MLKFAQFILILVFLSSFFVLAKEYKNPVTLIPVNEKGKLLTPITVEFNQLGQLFEPRPISQNEEQLVIQYKYDDWPVKHFILKQLDYKKANDIAKSEATPPQKKKSRSKAATKKKVKSQVNTQKSADKYFNISSDNIKNPVQLIPLNPANRDFTPRPFPFEKLKNSFELDDKNSKRFLLYNLDDNEVARFYVLKKSDYDKAFRIANGPSARPPVTKPVTPIVYPHAPPTKKAPNLSTPIIPIKRPKPKGGKININPRITKERIAEADGIKFLEGKDPTLVNLLANLEVTPTDQSGNNIKKTTGDINSNAIIPAYTRIKILKRLEGESGEQYYLISLAGKKESKPFVAPQKEIDRAINGQDRLYASVMAFPTTRGLNSNEFNFNESGLPILIDSNPIVKVLNKVKSDYSGKEFYLVEVTEEVSGEKKIYSIPIENYDSALKGYARTKNTIFVSYVKRDNDGTYKLDLEKDDAPLAPNSHIKVKHVINTPTGNYLIITKKDDNEEYMIPEGDFNRALVKDKFGGLESEDDDLPPKPAPMPPSNIIPTVPEITDLLQIKADKRKKRYLRKTKEKIMKLVIVSKGPIKISRSEVKEYSTLYKGKGRYSLKRTSATLKLDITQIKETAYFAVNDITKGTTTSLNTLFNTYFEEMIKVAKKMDKSLKDKKNDEIIQKFLKTDYGRCVSSGLKHKPPGFKYFYCKNKDQKKADKSLAPPFMNKKIRAAIAGEYLMAEKCLSTTKMEIFPTTFHESRFYPNAVSSRGVTGVGQVTGGAATDVKNMMLKRIDDIVKSKPECEYLKELKHEKMRAGQSCIQQHNPKNIRMSVLYSLLYYMLIKEQVLELIEKMPGIKELTKSDKELKVCYLTNLSYNSGYKNTKEITNFVIKSLNKNAKGTLKEFAKDYYERSRKEGANYTPYQLRDLKYMQKSSGQNCMPEFMYK